MKKSLLTLLISSAVLMTGCEDGKMTQTVLEAEKTIVQLGNELKATKSDLEKKIEELNSLSTVKAENEKLKAELAKAQAHLALQVEIVKIFDKGETIEHPPATQEEYGREMSGVFHFVTIPKTNMAWLNQLLINKAYGDEEIKKNPNPTEEDLRKQSEVNYQQMIEAVKETPVIGIEESLNSYYLGQRNNLAVFVMDYYAYSGGAHGINYTRYLNVDLNKKIVIGLNDLINPKNHDKLKKILWTNYSSERLGDNGKYNGFADEKDFRISEDFYFDGYGINFVYPPYELGPYAEGNVQISASWYEINELLNSEYQRTEKDGFFPEALEYR